MLTIKTDQAKFNEQMRKLFNVAGVSATAFIKNESRLMAQDLAKAFTQKTIKKAEHHVEMDRRVAFKIGPVGLSQIRVRRCHVPEARLCQTGFCEVCAVHTAVSYVAIRQVRA